MGWWNVPAAYMLPPVYSVGWGIMVDILQVKN